MTKSLIWTKKTLNQSNKKCMYIIKWVNQESQDACEEEPQGDIKDEQ